MRLPLVLAASVLANAAMLAVVAYHPSIAPASVRDFFPSRSAVPLEAKSATTDKTASHEAAATKANLWASLDTADLRELAARMRAAGFPAAVIRAVINARIDAQFASRFKELGQKLYNSEFWKSEYAGGTNTKLREEVSALYRERSKLQRSILNDDVLPSTEEATAAQRRRFGDLSKAKIDLVQQVEDDYAEMISQVRASMQGITLPEDREKLALLQREKHADLASMLTPDELADYEMRTSTVTTRLRGALTIMDASDAEFRAIYNAYKPYQEDLFPSAPTGSSMTMMEKRRELQGTVNDQLKATLGDRYADFARSNDRDYQQLYRLTKGESLPVTVANQAYALRNDIATQSSQIAENAALSLEDRRAALKTLGQNARVQLSGLLGQTVGPAYANSASWLRYLDNGSAFGFSADGTARMQPVRSAPRPKG